MNFKALAISATVLLAPIAAGATETVKIVAAENVYGDLATQVAGPHATVFSILSNPDQDPHLFEADPQTARALSDAKVVISNGLDYDPWMDKLLNASPSRDRTTISVGDLIDRHPGDNPHLWYDPATMRTVAKRLASDLATLDPVHKADYARGADAYGVRMEPLEAKMAALKRRFAGTPVTASEPVFGLMAQALGLEMRNQAFQTAVMNGTEPSASAVAAFEDDLRTRKVRAMLYNSQADDQAVKRLVGIAREAGVPVVGVTETEPADTPYATWMLTQLDALEQALAGGRS